MDASHLRKDPPHPKDALTAQSPIVVLKAATVLQVLESLPVEFFYHLPTLKGGRRTAPTVQRDGTMPTSTTLQQGTATFFESKEPQPF